MGKTWERRAAAAGLLFVVVVIASFFTPGTPDIDDPTAEVVRDIADDRTGLILSAYLSGIASVLFLAFTSGLWGRLRAAEADRGPSTLTLLGGVGSTLMILIANGVLLALVNAADEGREPEAVRALFELDSILFIGIGFTTTAFYAGVAMSAIPTRSLPDWLGWTAALLAVAFPIALLGTFSQDDEGGVLGGIFFIALLINFLWILAASIVMLGRGPEPVRRSPESSRSPGTM